jgi:MFS family permease
MDYKKALLIFLSLTVMINISDRLIFIIVPMWLLERSFSATEIGAIFSAAAIAMMLVRFLVSKLSDRWGRKRIMAAGLFTSAVSTALYPFASRIHDYAMVKSLQEAGTQLHDSVKNAMIGDAFKGEKRTRAISILGTAHPLGRACAMIIGIIITTFLSVVYGFFIAAASVFVAGMIILLFYREGGFVVSKKKIIGLHGITTPIILISLASFCNMLSYTIAYFPGFFVLSRSLGLTENGLFHYFLLAYIISAFFAYRTGSWITKHGKKNMLIITGLSYALFIALYSVATSVILLVSFLIGVAVSFYVYSIAFRNVLLDLTDEDNRGEQTGFSKLISDTGLILGPMIGGLLIDFVSLQSAFIVAGLFGIIGSMIVVYLKRYG